MRLLKKLIVVGVMATATHAYAGNGDLVVDGKIGISNTLPQASLDLGSAVTSRDYHFPLLWYNDNNSGPYAGTKGGIYLDQFGLSNNSTAVFATSASAPGTLIFASKDTGATALVERVRIEGQTGNVGIGTTGPTYKLSVNGVLGPGSNTRSDGGYGGIDFTNNGIGYPYSAKIYTFRSDSSGEYYGFTNDYDGVGAQLSIISKQAGGNIGFYTGDPATRKMSITSAGNVGIGTVYPNATLQVNGSFAATVKNFDIKDPRYNDGTRRLIHSTLEGPEVGVYYRGEAKLEKGRATVTLPPYFEALTRKENRTVLLTPKFDQDEEVICSVAASGVKNGEFAIRAFGVPDPSACGNKVFWEVKAERSDVGKLYVEEIREDFPEKIVDKIKIDMDKMRKPVEQAPN